MKSPLWLREFEAALQLSRQFYLWGNVRDVALLPGRETVVIDVPSALWSVLSRHHYAFMLVYDQVDGIRLHPGSDREAAFKTVSRRLTEAPAEITLDDLGAVLRALCDPATEVRGAALLDYGSRLRGPADHPPDRVHDFYVLCEKLSHTARRMSDPEGSSFAYNPIVWILDNERDVPPWLTAGNDDARLLPIPEPSLDERAELARMLLGQLPAERWSVPEAAVGRLAAATHGFRLRGLMDVSRILAGRPDLDIEDAIRAYTLGTDESPWRGRQLWTQIAKAEHPEPPAVGLRERVLGQDAAVTRALDILKRSAVGLSGAQASSQPSRPRGVMFFAGPTGVGKTELAKGLAQVVFGDSAALVRFDMSEYRGEENSARLIGAPPGYTGHDAGGQLTNAVRERPFRLLLFDEIDKAHPRILDNFLQILDDGRLTDGQGATVHFTECLIVFTSNLGILSRQPDGSYAPNVTDDDDYRVVQEKVIAAITEHFHRALRRPELLNRIGDNVIVFDFIRPPVDRRIFDLMVGNVVRHVHRTQGVELRIAPEVLDRLAAWATADRSYGGRGIGNRVETALVNPLSRAVFERIGRDGGAGTRLLVRGARQDGEIWTLDVAYA